jgi:DNA repair exonuclease SbcCD ATPase subunit
MTLRQTVRPRQIPPSIRPLRPWPAALLLTLLLVAGGCSSTYYTAMEKVGVYKRDILVDRVEEARDSQAEAQQQFQSALQQFASVVKLKNTDLKKAYTILEKEYNASKKAADRVTERINSVEDVSEALFYEWDNELDQYDNKELRRASAQQLRRTRAQYDKMIASMRTAEKSMEPILRSFHDNVLFLKHNLNAQAIGSLQGEFTTLKRRIEDLITKMKKAIDQSNVFIARMNG